ncbi:MAG TPA: mechanosensitive ion channel family protein [Actinomycetota bacterium]|nr:mechanosensitive ion channel family protein [Actinomycetota bacterium]
MQSAQQTAQAMKKARPQFVRAGVAAAVAIAGFVVGRTFGQFKNDKLAAGGGDPAGQAERLMAVGGAVVVLVAGILAVRYLGTAVRRAIEEKGEDGRATAIVFVMSLFGYAIVILATIAVLDVKIEKLLLGGALTGVIVGIAAQQSLGNFFAGIVLLLVRPFAVGDHVVLRSGPLGGEYEGRVIDMSLFYVDIITDRGPVKLPNAGVLASAIGPGARSPDEEPDEEEIDPGTAQGGTAAGG